MNYHAALSENSDSVGGKLHCFQELSFTVGLVLQSGGKDG